VAYKAAEVVSKLVQRGAEVGVIMTAAAQRFVTPLTFKTLAHQSVLTDFGASRWPSSNSPARSGRD
jgi:phosphopantothenoylcysteine synthetase/decarboxylase